MGRLIGIAVLLILLTWPTLGSADAMPPGYRSVRYQFSVTNLDAYPNYVFFVFPTTNYGFAYQLEKGKSIAPLLLSSRSISGVPSALYAIERKDFKRAVPKVTAHHHGENGALVNVFKPPPKALKAAADIEPPGIVPTDSPLKSLEKVFVIKRLDQQRFELVQTQEITTTNNGKRTVSQLPEPASSASATTSQATSAPAASPTAKRPTHPAAAASGPRGQTAPTATPRRPPTTPPEANSRGCAGCIVLAAPRQSRGLWVLAIFAGLLWLTNRRGR